MLKSNFIFIKEFCAKFQMAAGKGDGAPLEQAAHGGDPRPRGSPSARLLPVLSSLTTSIGTSKQMMPFTRVSLMCLTL
jgi:hypothetical protein